MATGNTAPLPSQDLAMTIMTTTAIDHAAGDAAVGVVGALNDGDDVGGGCGPGWFDTEDALVLAADAVATLIADNANGGDGSNGGVAVIGGTFKDAVVRVVTAGASGVRMMTMGGYNGDYADPTGTILDDDGRHPLGPPWRIQHSNHGCSRREVTARADAFTLTHSDGTT